MKAPMKNLFFLLVLSVIFSACQKDQEELQPMLTSAPAYVNVPSPLWDYFHRFEIAAEQRGVLVDLNALQVTAEFESIPEDGVAGTCTYGSHRPGHVVIDEDFWDRASDLLKEMIVFHELGHCTLFLGHREGVLANGSCASIMRSGLEACRDNYSLETRADYLDELFEME